MSKILRDSVKILSISFLILILFSSTVVATDLGSGTYVIPPGKYKGFQFNALRDGIKINIKINELNGTIKFLVLLGVENYLNWRNGSSYESVIEEKLNETSIPREYNIILEKAGLITIIFSNEYDVSAKMIKIELTSPAFELVIIVAATIGVLLIILIGIAMIFVIKGKKKQKKKEKKETRSDELTFEV